MAGLHATLNGLGVKKTGTTQTQTGFKFDNAAQEEAFKKLFGNGRKK